MDQPFQYGLSEDWLRVVASKALEVSAPGHEAYQLSLAVTCDETVRSLNRDYRGLDEITDVLSFSASHSGHWEGEAEPPEIDILETADPSGAGFVYPPGEAAPLGEVIIAYPQAQRQAMQRGVPLEQELSLLIVHGVLHLTGHDHLEPLEQAVMQRKEQAALNALPPAAITRGGMRSK